MMLNIHPIPAFKDNYIYCLWDSLSKNCLLIDPGDAAPAIDYIEKNQLHLTHILLTHHHYDHTQGVPDLLRYQEVPVYASSRSNFSFPFEKVQEHQNLYFESLNIYLSVLEIPGHTLDHIGFYNQDFLFCGDTLFAAGCGRLFEGTADMLFNSLQKMVSLAPHCLVYCAHEYTLRNLEFAHHIEPNNGDILLRLEEVKQRRLENQVSLPSTMEIELKTNPFLRVTEKSLKLQLSKMGYPHLENPLEIFTLLRKQKDDF